MVDSLVIDSMTQSYPTNIRFFHLDSKLCDESVRLREVTERSRFLYSGDVVVVPQWRRVKTIFPESPFKRFASPLLRPNVSENTDFTKSLFICDKNEKFRKKNFGETCKFWQVNCRYEVKNSYWKSLFGRVHLLIVHSSLIPSTTHL